MKSNWLFALPIVLWACGEHVNEKIIARYYNGVKKQTQLLRSDTVFKEILFYESGERKCETDYANNQAHGECLCWLPNGQLVYSVSYVNGKREGAGVEYDSLGHKQIESMYVADKLKTITYYRAGVKFMDTNEDSRIGHLWYASGQMENECHFVTGICNTFYKNGLKKITGFNKDGQKDGIWQYWGADGMLVKEERYDQGEMLDEKVYDRLAADSLFSDEYDGN